MPEDPMRWTPGEPRSQIKTHGLLQSYCIARDGEGVYWWGREGRGWEQPFCKTLAEAKAKALEDYQEIVRCEAARILQQ